MLEYAASRPRVGARQSSPNALLFIICAHVVVVAVIISAKMTVPPREVYRSPPIISIPLPHPPPPKPPQTIQPRHSTVPAPRPLEPTPLLPLPTPRGPILANPLPNPGPIADDGGPDTAPVPPLPQPVPVARSTPAQPITPVADLKPPYPQSKLLTGEEASLTLRLTIDERGRVVAVDPVGRADPVFLAAARKHLIAHWTYKPAIQDGRAVPSTAVVTLRFQLDD